MVGKNLKDAFEKTMRHEHARSHYVNDGNPLLGGNGLKDIFALGRGSRDARAFTFRIARVENQHRNIFLNGWQQRSRMQDLRAEIGKLRCFLKAYILDASRVRT